MWTRTCLRRDLLTLHLTKENGMTEYEWKKYLRVLERDSKDPALSRLGLSPNAYNALLLERLRGAGRRQANRAITK